MSTEKQKDAIDVSKITEKQCTVAKYKATLEPMTKFEKKVGNDAGISKGSANNAWQDLKKDLDMNATQIIILAKTTDTFDKKK